MKTIRADLHIHSLLSPCASLEMTPREIISRAQARGLDMIAVSDHNSTLHCELTVALGEKAGIKVLRAAEVTSAEDVHSLVILPDEPARTSFQQWIDSRSARIPHNPDIFGDQVVIDENENIIMEIKHFLTAALNASIDEVEAAAHRHGGLFIPAHIDRPSMSITSQLGFIPDDLYIDAVEVVGRTADLLYPVIRNSDAHIPEHIGRRHTEYMLDHPSFEELTMALRGENGRHIITASL
ncbi:MAG: PHP-associated domain-containing protein [Bacteroidales bacterium]|jgi:PHP family Zn ribbon phosphoesterase|nr:PHP-associated domain-containing protein [Bacteroidales bacterium]